MKIGNLPVRDLYVTTLSVAWFALNVWAVLTWSLDDAQLRALFLAFTLVFAFSLYSMRLGRSPGRIEIFINLLAIALSLAVTLYLVFDYQTVFFRSGRSTMLDLAVAGVALVLVLEATRRTTGWALPALSVIFLLYAFWFGNHVPGFLRIPSFSPERVLSTQYLSLSGILGVPLNVMIQYVFLFVVFGSVLSKLGAIDFFIDLSKAIAGGTSGGGAKIAVISSGLMGSVSGSAVANVMTTGVVTIPMMKREGFRASFAGATEAAASTGGQLLPPVMGAAAFLMAEFTRTPYAQILKYALIPALFYYVAILVAVHFESRRLNLRGAPRSELPKIGDVLRAKGGAVLPLAVLTVMIIKGYSPSYAVLVAMACTVIVAFIMPATRKLVTVRNLLSALRDAGEASVALFAAAACAGIIVGIVGLTGLGLKISILIVDYSMGFPLLGLGLAAITCLIMGLGLPTQIIYLTLAVLVAPGLMNMGLPGPGVHLFILYMGMMSMVTPPVSFAAFAAASIAKSNQMETGVEAFRLAISGLIIPFYFVFNPGILMIGSLSEIILDVGRLAIALAAATFIMRRQLNPVGSGGQFYRVLCRLCWVAAIGLLLFPNLASSVAGIFAAACGFALNEWSGRGSAGAQAQRS